MKIRIQLCRFGYGQNPFLAFRALVCGGICRVNTTDGLWTRKTASAMLDQLEEIGFDRKKVRFTHE